MDIDEVKQELFNYSEAQRIIKHLERNSTKIEELKEKATKITQTLNDMPTGNSEITDKKIAERVAEYVDLENESIDLDIKKGYKILELKKKNLEVYNAVLGLNEPYRTILYQNYIEGIHNLSRIAESLEKDYKHICKLHGIALLKYKEIRIKGR
jgi:NADH:ubiquinone oxidoreductase subunit D